MPFHPYFAVVSAMTVPPALPRHQLLAEAVRLAGDGLSQRQISRRLKIPRSTLRDHLRRARSELTLDAVAAKAGGRLARLANESGEAWVTPDWVAIHRQLRLGRGSSRLALWCEYRRTHQAGMGYSSFCQRYRSWLSAQPAFTQLDCHAGDWMLVDFWEYPVSDLDPDSPRCCVFVAMLGMSGYLFAQAPTERTTATWVEAHRHAFSFYQGVPRAVLLLRPQPWAGSAGWPRQALNPDYEEMARQHHTVIVPPATFWPRPVAAAAGVLTEISALAASAVLDAAGDGGRLRAILQSRVDAVNESPIPGWGVARQELYEADERQRLGPLPAAALSPAAYGR
jgi:hypothetical protein